jgi:PAS domain S-box-containing protein
VPDSLIDLAGLQVAAEDFLVAVLETTAQPIWVVDPDGVIRFANPAAIAALGYDSADELSGRNSHETIHHSHPDGSRYPAADCPMLLPRVTGETVASDLDWFFRRDGSMFPVSYISVPLEMRDGRGAVVAFTDIEERLRVERELRERDESLAAQQASLRRIATLVAGGARSAEIFAAVAREVASLLELHTVQISRYEPDGTATIIGAFSDGPQPFEAGTRWPLDEPAVLTEVKETGLPARRDDHSDLAGAVADAARSNGIRSGAGAPIIIDGEVWGVMATFGREAEPLPDRVEDRLAELTALIAAAFSNTASRDEIARLVDEQAALRRVATLVARESSPDELLATVAEEVARVLDVEAIGMLRFEPDGTAALVAQSNTPWEPPPLGTRFTLEGENVVSAVFRTRESARLDDWAKATGPVAEMARALGIRSSVATPIVVEGRLWGTLIAVTSQSDAFPLDTEARIREFTELVATAIANAEARDELSRLVDEQAALRRVATLVAEGATPNRVFDAVRVEVEQMFGIPNTILMRFDADEMATLLATPGGYLGPVGTRWPLEGDDSAVAGVYRTGRAARVEYTAGTRGPLAEAARVGGTRFPVAVPVVVDGALWGAMSVGSPGPQPPPDLEARLTKFTQLVATAIANTEARTEVQRLADEQAALRRVATLVAEGAPPTEVFDAVIAEVGELLGAAQVGLARYENEQEISVLAIRGQGPEVLRAGVRLPLDGDSVNARILRTGRSARLNFSEEGSGSIAEAVRRDNVNATVGAPVVVDGALWGMIGASWRGEDRPPADAEERLAQFAELLDTAIANADTRDQLMASRARVLTAADEARRRVVRDLHDGAQQRLVHTIVTLKLARRALREDKGRAESLLAEALNHAELSNAELRELSHGILPSVLTRGGLRAGIDALVSRLDIPIDVHVTSARVPPEIEASGYFIVAEALTNVVKHSQATRAEVTVAVDNDMLTLVVRDDGIGGADPGGHGLVGISDRAAALGGRLRVDSTPGGGTELAAELPLPV